jgi:hypothetical protein
MDKQSDIRMLLMCPETQKWSEELLRNKLPHVNEEISLREILTVNKVTEQGNLGTFAYKVKCKWENQV